RFRITADLLVPDPGQFGVWKRIGTCEGAHDFSLRPQPIYLAFISRSNRPADDALVEPFRRRIEEWGFETHTVGWDVEPRNPEDVAPEVREWIAKSDCLVAVVTPRDLLAEGTYHPPQWIQSEIGIAFGKEKPFLTIHDERVKIAGLPQRAKRLTYPSSNLRK